MECDLSESAMIDNLFDNEIFRLERMDEFVTTEQNTDIDYTRPSIYHEPADYYWGDNGDTLASEHHGSSEITGNSPVQSADDENDNISRGDNSRFTTTTQTVSCEVLNNNQSDIVDTGEIEEAAEHSDRNNDCNHDKLTHEVDDVDDDRDGESNNNDDVGDIDDADNDSI
uniref:Uncharacterized protein n=1 Tax=Setaria digitata TaxID=48799 RepID=A0A915PRK8_9BILA